MDAGLYPLGMVEDEVALIIERQNGQWATMGTIVQGAGASIMSKKGGQHFTKLMKRLIGE